MDVERWNTLLELLRLYKVNSKKSASRHFLCMWSGLGLLTALRDERLIGSELEGAACD